MNTRKTTKKISKTRIYRAVASSSAIETGHSIQSIEARLKNNISKYNHLTLAQ